MKASYSSVVMGAAGSIKEKYESSVYSVDAVDHELAAPGAVRSARRSEQDGRNKDGPRHEHVPRRQ